MNLEHCPITLQDVLLERQIIPKEIADIKHRGLSLLRHIPEVSRPLMLRGISPIQNKLEACNGTDAIPTNPPPVQTLSTNTWGVNLQALIVQYHTNRWLNQVIQPIYPINQTLEQTLAHIPPQEQESGIWILVQRREVRVPVQLPSELCNDYVNVRYNMFVATGEYWSRLHTQDDLLLLARLRYYDYLDVTSPSQSIVVYDAFYVHGR